VLLFFGNIAPYKGVHRLVEALALSARRHPRLHLVIAGRPKGSEAYWKDVERTITRLGIADRIFLHIEYIPDERVEVFCKAADALVLPYTHVFQSGVLFLGYSFGLPVIATDVGSLREEIVPGRTGWICRPDDPDDLAQAIETWLQSDTYRDRQRLRAEIRAFANERYSWASVARTTHEVYASLAGTR
jgi:glycosyltransferase involved in cell wall biosynthesis